MVVRSEALRPATFERQRSVYSADVSVASRICSIYSVATAIIPWGSLMVILWNDVGMFVVVNGLMGNGLIKKILINSRHACNPVWV